MEGENPPMAEVKEDRACFSHLDVQHNDAGWGPCELPAQFQGMPFQPFSKGDPIGKVNLKLFNI